MAVIFVQLRERNGAKCKYKYKQKFSRPISEPYFSMGREGKTFNFLLRPNPSTPLSATTLPPEKRQI